MLQMTADDFKYNEDQKSPRKAKCLFAIDALTSCDYWFQRRILSFFWEGSTFSDAGSDGTQPASCVDIQNRQSTYSCRCLMYRACQNDVFCGLFYSATLAIRCRSKAPFVYERLKTPNTSPQAVEPDP